jgi:ribose/xylose/arabinose/galactoside ABC-type transport system permease subunit
MNSTSTAFQRLDRTQKSNVTLKIVYENLIWFLLALCLIVMAFISNTFFSKQNLINLAVNSTALGLLVIAESLCLIVGKLDISIESTLAFSALMGALLVKSNVNPVIAMFAVLAVGAVIGLINGASIVLLGANPFMQTLSMNIIFRGLMLVFTGGVTVFRFPDSYRVFGDTEVLGIPTPIILLVLFYVFFIILLQKRTWGRKLYAVGSNERAAFISGINVKKMNTQVFVLAGLLSAFAGLIASTRFNGVHNNLAKGQVFEVFAAAVMGGISLTGGRGKLIGAIGGVLFLGCITSILTWLRVDPFVVQTTRGCIILLAILIDAMKNRLREKILIS